MRPYAQPPPIMEPKAYEGRVPPHDLDAEAAVVGAVLFSQETFDAVGDVLIPEHFYSEKHRRIYEAFVELREKGEPIDTTTVGSWLKSRERLAQVGGMGFLIEVMNRTPVLAHMATYGKTIREKWRARQLVIAGHRIFAEGYGDYGGIDEYADRSEQAVYNVAHDTTTDGLTHVKEGIVSSITRLQEAAKRGDAISGIATGLTRLDHFTAGLHEGDLTIVAARPGMGKTSLVLDIAMNIARSGDVLVPIFSLEMPREQLSNRLMCADARVNLSKIRQPRLISAGDWQNLTIAAGRVAQLPIWIDDQADITLTEIRARVRRKKRDCEKEGKRVGPVLVDYLQLMKGPAGAQNREQEISMLSRGLKMMAKELKVPVVALSQLNRSVESRSDKRPILSDLRESGAIEQDADNIIFIYRDDYYNKEDSEEPNVAELIIAKQRNGPTGTAKVRYDSEYTHFDNLADGEYYDDQRAGPDQ